ncbi:MAG: winged helix-turn-helix transcriptional regulator [Candidatus Aenigmarchaeota archaeon]|nr:winged helix-turn-helix transcriptional regulator [Candidatus Aenigmarchaeota archaeon]
MLNKTQLLILEELAKHGYYLTVTSLVDSIVRKYNIPRSTVRYNVKKLRNLGLIECGDVNNKGVPARLTELGKSVVGDVSLVITPEIRVPNLLTWNVLRQPRGYLPKQLS